MIQVLCDKPKMIICKLAESHKPYYHGSNLKDLIPTGIGIMEIPCV